MQSIKQEKESSKIDNVYFQLVHRRKPRDIWYIRKFTPVKSENVKVVQALFAEAAKKAKGEKFTSNLPPAAIKVKEQLTNLKIGRVEKPKKWQEELEELAKLLLSSS